jgi:hypothetical protein
MASELKEVIEPLHMCLFQGPDLVQGPITIGQGKNHLWAQEMLPRTVLATLNFTFIWFSHPRNVKYVTVDA